MPSRSPGPYAGPADMDAIDEARWHRVKEVFYDALDASAADRAAFVEAACGADVWLRDEVDSLLKATMRPAASSNGR